MKQPPEPERYVQSFEVERIRRGVRYHWMVCGEHSPDKLVAWGHAPTQEQAETAAKNEIDDLAAGRSKGGHVASSIHPFTARRPWHR